jgi:hypothetical protein
LFTVHQTVRKLLFVIDEVWLEALPLQRAADVRRQLTIHILAVVELADEHVEAPELGVAAEVVPAGGKGCSSGGIIS